MGSGSRRTPSAFTTRIHLPCLALFCLLASVPASGAASSKAHDRAVRDPSGTDFSVSAHISVKEGADQTSGNRIVIGVMADHDSIFGLGRAAFETWYQDVSKIADIYFVIGECSYPPEMKDAVLCLDTPDVYPPQVKEFKMWQHFAKYPKGKYDFFFKVDLDTYVNARPLQRLLEHNQMKIDELVYSGFSAFGREEERGKLGLTKPYCLGFGYLMTYQATQVIDTHAEECMGSFASSHSDTEIGRCLANHAGIECTHIAEGLNHIYYQIIDGEVANRVLTRSGQSVASFPQRPPKIFFDSVLLHPIKKSDEMRQFYLQSKHYLRPIFQPLRTDGSSFGVAHSLIELANAHLMASCVHNPSYQRRQSGIQLPECVSPPAEYSPFLPLEFFVVHRDSARLATLPQEISELLVLRSFVVNRADFSVSPKVAYLNAARKLFEQAEEQGLRYLGILTEDVLLRCDLINQLQTVLQNERCAGHLFTEFYGGVLSLGAREWVVGDWEAVVTDFANSRRAAHGHAKCYNTGNASFATFATIFSRSVFSEVLLWLDENHAQEPFHFVLNHLSETGHIVRTAFPYLAIQDPDSVPVYEGKQLEKLHNLVQAKDRVRAHKWTPENYCYRVIE